jgi:hypothetical protein
MPIIHVNRSGTSLGTFSEEDVRIGLRSGRFLGSDLGWREGMATWQPLSQFAEFAPDITAATTAAPASAGAGSAAVPAISPAISAAGILPERAGLPWDQRQTKGFFNAFVETMVMVLTKPVEAFTVMRRQGGFGDPLIYSVCGGGIGLLFYFVYQFFITSLGTLGNRENPLAHLVGTGIGGVFLIICIPLLIVIGAFVGSAILHLCLLLVGGAKQPFETTFRVVCFSGGSVGPIMIVPLCGGFIACVWKIVLYCIGLARAHETDTGRAVLAVFLPLIVCCGGGLFLGMMFGVLGAWGLSHH